MIVIVAYAIIAAQLLVALVESYIVIGGGILLLGFSGSRWTKFFSERYLSYVASVGVKLFVLYLIMGIGMSIAAGGSLMAPADSGALKVTEVMYSPLGGAEYEFIELHNISPSASIDLTSMTFSNGITYAFPIGSSLGPNAYGLVVRAVQAGDFAEQVADCARKWK